MMNMHENQVYDVYAAMQSIKKDKHSWLGWHCLEVEVADTKTSDHNRRMRNDIKLFIGAILKGRIFSVLYATENVILIFCKNIPMDTLDNVGQNILDYLLTKASLQGCYKIFDVFKDSESLVAHYPANVSFSHSREAKIANLRFTRQRIDIIPGLNHPKALLVEDDPVTRWVVRTALRQKCHLATAQTADQAIHLYADYRPDIVFLDINLPGKSGQYVLEELLKRDPGACIVMFSSHEGMENIVAMMEIGAKGFIAKPFDLQKLLYYLNRYTNL